MARVVGLLVAAAVVSPATSHAAGKKYALLIGIDDYGPGKAEGITRLGFASKDVTDLEQALKGLGYDVARPRVNEYAERRDILKQLGYYAETLTVDDTFILFFAGHGVRARNGHTYWLTRDASLSFLDENGIRLEHLMDFVRDIQAKKKLVLLDHCYSGDVTPALGRSRSIDSGSPAGPEGARSGEGGFVLTRGVSRVKEIGDEIHARGSGLLVLAAARDEAFESDTLKHGVFTAALLEALRSRKASQDNSLSALELLLFVGNKVKELGQTLRLPDQGVQPVFDPTGFSDWEIGRPPSGSAEDYLSTLRRWVDREWITVDTKMRCKTVIEKWARTSAGGPALTAAESTLLQEVQQHMQFPEGEEEAWARELEATLKSP